MPKFSLKHFWKHIGGNFAVSAALLSAPLFGAVALGIDYANIHSKKSELQQLADAAALAATRELSLSKLTDEKIQSIAESYVNANMAVNATETVVTKAVQSADATTVTVDLSYTWQPFFAHYLDDSALPIVAGASASFSGQRSSVCVLALDEVAAGAIDMTSAATVTANGCSVFSNSRSTKGIEVGSRSALMGESIFTSGGYDGLDASFVPLPITDSPMIPDPLAQRAAPSFSGCDKVNYEHGGGNTTISPGVYCGGMDIYGNGSVTLLPGNYIIKDGLLSVYGSSTLKGDGIGFYFVGASSKFDFGLKSTLSLSAPKSGPLAGILFFEDRSSPELRLFEMRSKNAEKFEGTVYLPKAKLIIDKESQIGQLSDWTAIIAKQISIGNGPNLVINSDYANSDIPVPEGIASTSDLRLIK